MANWDVVVVGGANTDYLVRGPQLPRPGETIEGHAFHEGPGGKGANQAVAAARLGGRVALVARVGRDPRGAALAQALEAERVATQFLVHDERSTTGVALIFVDRQGEKQILTAPGANRCMTVADVLAAAAALASTRAVLAPLEAPLDCIAEAFRIARAAGAVCVLDPAPATALPDEFLRLVSVIRPNATEAEVLTGIPVRDRDSARQAAWRLLDRGVEAVAVQAGDDGNLLVSRELETLLPKIPVAAVDATGAGDAFAAGLAIALGDRRPLGDAGPFASACAALATTRVGAQAGLPRREEVLKLLAGHEV